MADLSDVINALAGVCNTALFPNGTASVSPITGVATKIYPTWPNSEVMDSDLRAGTVSVSVYSGRTERNVSRTLAKWKANGPAAGGLVPMLRERRRTLREFQITFWCPTPHLRDLTAPPVEIALAGMRSLALADGSTGRLEYARSTTDDSTAKELLYRRDLFYQVEYALFETMQAPVVTTVTATVHGGIDAADKVTNVLTIPRTIP
jgi:hypothetical protein